MDNSEKAKRPTSSSPRGNSRRIGRGRRASPEDSDNARGIPAMAASGAVVDIIVIGAATRPYSQTKKEDVIRGKAV